jgi:hypothetical protein
LRRELCVDLRLLTRLCFFDRSHVRSDTALRAHLGLPLHLRALLRESSRVSVSFRARCSLCSICCFSRFAGAGSCKEPPFGVYRCGLSFGGLHFERRG